jgi:hypothetical protein
LLFLSRRH